MLALTQMKGESVFITCPDGSEIEILLYDIRGKRTRVGIAAPMAYEISRSGPYRGGVPIAAPEPEPDPVPVPALT